MADRLRQLERIGCGGMAEVFRGALVGERGTSRAVAVKRLRPKFMSVSTTFIGLVPIMWSIGAGADVMKRITAPLIGGIFTSFILELVVYPAIYEVWKWHFEVKKTLPAA